jgi:hypothetical protein
MHARDRPNNSEAEAVAFRTAASGIIGPVKPIEDARQRFGRDT